MSDKTERQLLKALKETSKMRRLAENKYIKSCKDADSLRK